MAEWEHDRSRLLPGASEIGRSAALDINDAGQIVGWSETITRVLGGNQAVARGINGAGQVVGCIFTVVDCLCSPHAALWSVGTTPPNRAPIASPGNPYSSTEGTAIAFDGSPSSDADG